jgi:hypothetical protein
MRMRACLVPLKRAQDYNFYSKLYEELDFPRELHRLKVSK